MKICIIGTGYVGLTTGVCLASKGHRVVCVDVVKEKVDIINNGKSPIYEKGLEQLLKKVLKNKKFKATTSLKQGINSEIVFICVDTP